MRKSRGSRAYHGLNTALNEAAILGVDFSIADKICCVTFYPIALWEDGSIPDDNRVLFVFHNINRIAASLTKEPDTAAIPFEPEKLPDIFSEFKHESLYGWNFIDNGKKIYKDWENNKSFDLIISESYKGQHTIDLFQEDRYSNKNIDLRIWFDEIKIFDSKNNPISLEVFIANGIRGWKKLYKDRWSTLAADEELGQKLTYVRPHTGHGGM